MSIDIPQAMHHTPDHVYPSEILPGVSRSFALTIPQLPQPLREVVTNAYLLCRIADTIEDDAGFDIGQKRRCHQLFLAALNGQVDAEEFARTSSPLVSARALPAERELMHNADRVLRVSLGFDDAKQRILRRHVGLMCRGMPKFQNVLKSHGLKDLAALDNYCYCVAGVVGEMLTELFCDYSADIATRADTMFGLAPSFGQGLQMTNILKDVWDDRENGNCWLPRDVFSDVGYDLKKLSPDFDRDAFARGLTRMTGIAHAHLRNALAYTLLIPRGETGIRRFCLWSIGLAVLTLQRIHAHPHYRSGQEVKVSRATVHATVAVTNVFSGSDRALGLLFRLAARGLPLADGVPSVVSGRRPSEPEGSPDLEAPALAGKVAMTGTVGARGS